MFVVLFLEDGAVQKYPNIIIIIIISMVPLFFQ